MKRDANWSPERRLFRDVTATTSLMAWATEPDGSCYYLSPAWSVFTGIAESDALGFNWLTAVHPEDSVSVGQAFFSANDQRVAYGMAYRLARADGEYCLVWDVGLPKFSDEGNFQGFFGTTCSVQQYQARDAIVSTPGNVFHKRVLSDREREVIKLISEGNTTDTVAAMLGIGVRTVDSHVAAAASKLGASNRVHAVAKALRLSEI